MKFDKNKLPEVSFDNTESKETRVCKGKCNHEMIDIGVNGGPIIKCLSCKRTFGDI